MNKNTLQKGPFDLSELEKRKAIIFAIRNKIREIQNAYKPTEETLTKGNPKEVVTEADRAIEELIVTKIKEQFSNDTIIGEEFDVSQKGTSGYTWYIDPIDGTVNFSHGQNYFATSIAVVKDNIPVLGVMISGENGKTYHAIKGQGAFCEDTRITVSKTKNITEALVESDLTYEEPGAKKTFDQAYHINKHAQVFSMRGSCVISLIHVATGQADAYYGLWPLKIHDYAAGMLLVQEAGGVTVHPFSGAAFTLPEKNILATTPLLVKQFVKLFENE